MFKSLMSACIALGVAFVLGIWSVDAATQRFAGFDTLTVNGWTTRLRVGTPDADSYSRAWYARSGDIALAAAEGLRFVRQTDDRAARLSTDCTYRIEGPIKTARAWALYGYAINDDGTRSSSEKRLLATSHSVIFDGERVAITISDRIHGGNWAKMPTDSGAFALELLLLDTPIGSGIGLSEPQLPRVLSSGCNNA